MEKLFSVIDAQSWNADTESFNNYENLYHIKILVMIIDKSLDNFALCYDCSVRYDLHCFCILI